MPELKTLPLTKVRDLKVGDFTTYGKVVKVDAKIKWAIVTFEGQVGNYDQRLQADSLFGCTREVPTAEEEAAKQLVYALTALDYKEQAARQALVSARESAIKQLEAGHRSSYQSWMDVPQAEALVELWDAVTHVHLISTQKDVPFTRIEAVRYVLRKRINAALSYYRAVDRSSSVISNLFDDLKIEALSTWRRELEWIIED